jgi:hypothetical protein
MTHPASIAPATARLAIQSHIAELRAELSAVTCPRERRVIAAELRAAEAAKLFTEG